MSADVTSITENKKLSKSSKSKANKITNNDLLHDGLVAEENTPMEVDCNEVLNKDINHEIKKEPMSGNSEHHQDSLKILQEFVKEKLHRTVLSFADFKKLLLLRQTGKWSGLAVYY